MSNDARADAHAIREIAAMSDGDAPHIIFHYLYTPSSEAADQIAEELRQLGFGTEVRLGAYRANWLVLARHEVIPTDELIASVRQSMEALIAKVGGEYDGWEAEIRPHGRHASRLH